MMDDGPPGFYQQDGSHDHQNFDNQSFGRSDSYDDNDYENKSPSKMGRPKGGFHPPGLGPPGLDGPPGEDLAPPGLEPRDLGPPGLEQSDEAEPGDESEFGSHPHPEESDNWDMDRHQGRGDFGPRGPPGNFNPRWRGPGGPPPGLMNRGGFQSRPSFRGGFNNRGSPDFNRPRGGPGPRGFRGPPPGMFGGPPRGWNGGYPMGHGPMSGMGPGGMGGPPQNPMFTDVDGEVWIEYKNDQGRPYYYNCKTQKTVWTKPKLKEEQGGPMIRMPGPSMPGPMPNPMGMHGGMPRLGGMPYGGGEMMGNQGFESGGPKKVWSEHRTDEGKVYYYNAITKQSVWDRPNELDDDTPKPLLGAEKVSIPGIPDSIAPAIMAARAAAAALAAKVNKSTSDNQAISKPEPIKELETQPDTADVEMQDTSSSEDEAPPEPQLETKKGAPPPDANKPVAINSVIGTPWCVVWTGDNRSFFYNAVSKESHWVIPDELKGNPRVEKLLSQPPKPKDREPPPPGDDSPVKKKAKVEKSSSLSKKKKPDGIIINMSSAASIIQSEEKQPKLEPAEKIEPSKYQKDQMTLEERQAAFREMLLDREVSAFSTWDKELHKIVFDPRYLLLSGRERKLAYESFIKSRAEDERLEKRNRLKDNRETFKKLIESANLSSRATFSDFAQKHGKDAKFKAIEKMKEREQLFNEWKVEQSDKKRERQVEVKEKDDEKEVKEEKRNSRDKSSDRSRERKDSKDSKAKQIKEDFVEMLRQGEVRISPDSSWSKKKKHFSNDDRYIAVGSSSTRESYFYEYTKSLDDKEKEREKEKSKEREPELSESEKKALSRKEREAAAMKKREGEVARRQVDQNKEWERERGAHARDEAQQHFLALLHDMVRDPDASWRKTRKQLRDDRRWELTSLIDADQKEKLFNEHIDNLSNKRKRSFKKLLDECEHVTLTSTWKEIRRKIKHDSRFSKFSSEDKEREAEFQRHVRDKVLLAKSDFKQLLREIKCVSHKSKEMLRGSNGDSHMREIRQFLTNDKRGLVLDDLPEERDRILDDYLAELEKFGPPPPPTATRPSKR